MTSARTNTALSPPPMRGSLESRHPVPLTLSVLHASTPKLVSLIPPSLSHDRHPPLHDQVLRLVAPRGLPKPVVPHSTRRAWPLASSSWASALTLCWKGLLL